MLGDRSCELAKALTVFGFRWRTVALSTPQEVVSM